MLLLSNLTRNGTIGGIAARKLELGIQESEQLPQATMSRTSDERLDETPTAEVQGLRGDIEETPSIQGVVSRSDGSSSRIGEPAANVHLSPAQEAARLLLRRSERLADQQGVRATTGADVPMINTPVNQSSLTNMETVPAGRRQESRTNVSFGSAATGERRQTGLPSVTRASTRQPANNSGTQQSSFPSVGMGQPVSTLRQEEFTATMDYSEHIEEEKDVSNEDIEVEMNFGNTGGTQRRSDSAELPNVARSGAEDSTLRSQQLEGVMTDVGGFSSERQDSGAYRPRSDSRMPVERIGYGISPVTGSNREGAGSGTYQDQGEQRARQGVAPVTTAGISNQQSQLDRMQAETLRLKLAQYELHAGTARRERHEYSEKVAKQNLKLFQSTALHLGGKNIAEVGDARCTYTLVEWIATTRKLGSDLGVLSRPEFLTTAKKLVHDQHGDHEGIAKLCQPNGRGRKDAGKDPKPHDFLRRWDAARNTNKVKELKKLLDAAYHTQNQTPPEDRHPDVKPVDYTPLFNLWMEIMQVDNHDVKAKDHRELYKTDNVMEFHKIRKAHVPSSGVISRSDWELIVDKTSKRARTVTNYTGGTYEHPPERVQMSLLAQKLAKWALDRQTTPEMQSFMTTHEVSIATLTNLSEAPLVESGEQDLLQEDGPYGYVHRLYEICVPESAKKYLIREEKLPKKMSDLTMAHLKTVMESYCDNGQSALQEAMHRMTQRVVKGQAPGHPDVGKSKGSSGQKKRDRGVDVRPVVAINQQQTFEYQAGKSLGYHMQDQSLATKLNCGFKQQGTQFTFAKDGSHCCSDYQKDTTGHLVNGKPLPGRDGTVEFMLICEKCNPPCHGHLADNHQNAPAGAKLTPVSTDLSARTKLAVQKNFKSTAKLVKKTKQPPSNRFGGGYGGRGRGSGNADRGRGRFHRGGDRRQVNAVQSEEFEALTKKFEEMAEWVEYPSVNMIEWCLGVNLITTPTPFYVNTRWSTGWPDFTRVPIMIDTGAAVYCVLGTKLFGALQAEGLVYDVRGKEDNVRLQSLTKDSLGYRHSVSLICPTENGAFQIREAYVCEGVPPYTAILGKLALSDMKALIDCEQSEVVVRLPFADPGALESALQSQCGDGATPEEVAEMQSKFEWFTHFSARQVDQNLTLSGASSHQIRSVMATLRAKPEVPESTNDGYGPVETASHGDCPPTSSERELTSTKEEHSPAIVEAPLDLEAITEIAMHSARVEEEEMRVATLLMAEFGGWHAFPMEPGLMVCTIENKQDQPTLHVAETVEDLSTELPVLGTEPTIDVAWKWLIIRLKRQLSSINNPPDGTPVVIGPEWEFVIGKLEKDVAQGIRTASECLGGSLPHASLHTTNAGRRHGPSLNDHLWSLLFELESAIGSGVVPSSEATTRLQQRTQQLLLSKLKKDELYHEIQQSRQENTNLSEPEVNSSSGQRTELPGATLSLKANRE